MITHNKQSTLNTSISWRQQAGIGRQNYFLRERSTPWSQACAEQWDKEGINWVKGIGLGNICLNIDYFLPGWSTCKYHTASVANSELSSPTILQPP